MRKKYILILILFIIVNLIYSKKIFAVQSDIDVQLSKLDSSILFETVDPDAKKKVIDELTKSYGYSDGNLTKGTDTMKFKTKIFILEEYESGDGIDFLGIFGKTTKYKIQIGGGAKDKKEKTGTILKDITKDDLINKYGYEEGKEEWPVVLIGGVYSETRDHRKYYL